MKNVALITGINGQDGSYLAEFLLEKGYEVHGLVRRHSISVTSRIDHLIHSPYNNVKFFLHYADTTDSSALMRIMAEIRPTEVYNLAAQSHVGISFEVPEYTADATGMSTLKLLEAVRINGGAGPVSVILLVARPKGRRTLPFLPGVHLRTVRRTA